LVQPRSADEPRFDSISLERHGYLAKASMAETFRSVLSFYLFISFFLEDLIDSRKFRSDLLALPWNGRTVSRAGNLFQLPIVSIINIGARHRECYTWRINGAIFAIRENGDKECPLGAAGSCESRVAAPFAIRV
jgi:hypothetical protein